MFALLRYLLVPWRSGSPVSRPPMRNNFPRRPSRSLSPRRPAGLPTSSPARWASTSKKASAGRSWSENKPGASNQIAAEYVARSPADGYTLLVSPEATVAINPFLFAKLHYNAATDFVPIAGLVKIHQALVTNPSVPARNVADFIALAKKQPGALNYGTYGVGSTGHLNMEMFEAMAAVQLVAIHYKGATPALTDVIAGHIQAMFISVGSAVQPWKAGEINLLGVGS